MKKVILTGFLLILPVLGYADIGLQAITVTQNAAGNETYSVSLQVLALMSALTFLPAILMMMTSFTRIIVVLAILRQAVGMPQTPTNQILIGLSIFLTLFVMSPVIDRVNQDAVQPYLSEKISVVKAIDNANQPV